jgi:serine/threonine protein kinase
MNAFPAALDRYQLKALIGEGSVSSVFRAFDPELKAEVAIKLLKSKDDLAPETYILWQDYLQREAAVMTALDHPAIPKVYQHAQTQAGDYIVMEYIAGPTLLQIMESSEGFLEEGAIIQWGIRVCEVLDYLHTSQPAPLLYRDVKPSNMMIDEAGQFHLLDFGISMPYIAGHTYECIGTEGYAAPEQYQGHEEIRSDLYALGASLHHLATRIDPREETQHRPFTFAPVRSTNPALSKPFAAVIQRALAYEPEDRFPSAAEMGAGLAACL